jgi:hypothetical protein
MTTIIGAPAVTKRSGRFLRVALRADSLGSGLTGLSLLGTKELSKDLFGFPPQFSLSVGVALLVFAAGVWLCAAPRRLKPKAVIAVIALNIGWLAATIATLATGVLPLTTLGVVYLIGQAIAVAVVAELEFIGLRRIGR